MDAWELLRQGQDAEALRAMQTVYFESDKSPSEAIELGAVYLWLNDWQAAWEHFCDFTDSYPSTMDFAFVFAGIAKWCAGNRVAAIAAWKDGIDVEYADFAGGMSIPLHLFLQRALNLPSCL